MKVSLVFAPFASLSYVPLGISYLKSYLKTTLPSIRVNNLDLSNQFFRRLERPDFVHSLAEALEYCPSTERTRPQTLDRQALDAARKVVLFTKDVIGDWERFQDPKTYNPLRGGLDEVYWSLKTALNRALKYSLTSPDSPLGKVLECTLLAEDIEVLAAEKADVIGFSVFSSSQLKYSLALAKSIKARVGCDIVFGGAYIAHLDPIEFLEAFEFVDFLVLKEGELALTSLLQNRSGGDLRQVPSLVYRHSGQVVRTPEAVVRDLDAIPFPDFSDFRIAEYFAPKPVVSTLLSRGCYWRRCSFCAHHATYANEYRLRSLQNVVEEFKTLTTQGIGHVWLADEILSAGFLSDLSKALRANRVSIKFGAMAKPTRAFSKSVLSRLREAGLHVMVWGVETFSQSVLDSMKKGTQSDHIVEVLSNSAESGILNIVYMMHGFPTQTEEHIREDVRILDENQEIIHRLGVHGFWLEKGTRIHDQAESFGVQGITQECLLEVCDRKLLSPHLRYDGADSGLPQEYEHLVKKRSKAGFADAGRFYAREHILLHASAQDDRLE